MRGNRGQVCGGSPGKYLLEESEGGRVSGGRLARASGSGDPAQGPDLPREGQREREREREHTRLSERRAASPAALRACTPPASRLRDPPSIGEFDRSHGLSKITAPGVQISSLKSAIKRANSTVVRIRILQSVES